MAGHMGVSRRDYVSAASFVEAGSSMTLPSRFEHFLGLLGVELIDQRRSHLRMRAIALQDWWFCWVEGGGRVRIIADRPSLEAADWDLLLYSARGNSRSLTQSPIVPAAGQFLLSRPGYAGDIVSEGPFGYLCVFIPPRYLNEIGRARLPYGLPTSVHHGAGAVAGASLRALVASAMGGTDPESCAALLPDVARLLFNSLQQIGATANDQALQAKRNMGARQFARVLEYMQTHYSDADLSVKSVANVCGLSERSIYRGFSRLGESFGSYLSRLRLENAAALLASQVDVTVCEVAYDSGFSSPSAFCRLFRRAYGVTPSRYGRSPHLGSLGKMIGSEGQSFATVHGYA